MASLQFPQVSDIIAKVSQDIRQQIGVTDNTPDQTMLVDYTNRIHKQMLRFSKWPFMQSEPQFFLTSKGQTDYWIGASKDLPLGIVDTGLNLPDVLQINKQSMIDTSNNRQITYLGGQPYGPQLNFRTGQTRVGLPAVFYQDLNDPNILHVFPGADNRNNFQPVPATPILTATVGGALPLRTYFVQVTFVDSSSGESTGSSISAKIIVPANELLTVVTPTIPLNKASSGVLYNQYNVYAAVTEGSETRQTASPIAMGANWTEPNTGLISSGPSIPNQNTLEPINAYIIKFRYFKQRLELVEATDYLQIPSNYQDIVVAGVSALAWKIIGRDSDAQASYEAYKGGMTEMIWDKNQFPDTDFIRPDPTSYVNQQNMYDSRFFNT